ncbi:hypothetical protein LUZ60_001889 [Juncus effusus]|nr:hypothetical protein LUZ60_001889 [Juncus effusus]
MDDWEILGSSDSPHKPKIAPSPQPNYDSDAGAIKHDYFCLDSNPNYSKRACAEEELEDTQYNSDNPSWVDPESFPLKDQRDFWSDDSNYSEKREIDQIGRDIIDLGSESDDSVGEVEEKAREKRWAVWWKVPFEMIRLYLSRIRPVWSISVAAAILGFMVLGRKLFKLNEQYKSRSITPLKIVLDEKKTTQLKARAARLNEAFSVVKRVPLIRASYTANGVTPWPVIGLH